MLRCIVKHLAALFKIEPFGLFYKLDFIEVCKGVYEVLPDSCDGVTVDQGFDVTDSRRSSGP